MHMLIDQNLQQQILGSSKKSSINNKNKKNTVQQIAGSKFQPQTFKANTHLTKDLVAHWIYGITVYLLFYYNFLRNAWPMLQKEKLMLIASILVRF